jgi:hypothetical protein
MPRLGTRLLAPLAGTGAKTGRHYGAQVAAIRELAARGLPFTSLSLPQYPRKPLGQVLNFLWHRGELQRLAPGHPGAGAPPAIYVLPVGTRSTASVWTGSTPSLIKKQTSDGVEAVPTRIKP